MFNGFSSSSSSPVNHASSPTAMHLPAASTQPGYFPTFPPLPQPPIGHSHTPPQPLASAAPPAASHHRTSSSGSGSFHDDGDSEAEEDEEAAGAPLFNRWSSHTLHPATRSLLTTEIGSFPRSFDPSTSRVIAGSRQWVCYSVANGHIRVIGATSGKTALLRGHSGKVLDLALRDGGKARCTYLASVSSGGEMYVWSLAIQGDELVTAAVLTGKYTAPGGQHYQRVMWTRNDGGSGLSVLLVGKEAVDLVALPEGVEGPVELHTANPLRLFAGSVQDAVVDEAGKQLVVADKSRVVTSIDVRTSERNSVTQTSTVQRLLYVPAFNSAAAFLVACLSVDGNRSSLVLMRTSTLSTVGTLDIHHPQHHFTHVDVDPTGSFLIVAHTSTEASSERQHGLLAMHIRRTADDARFDWLSSYKTNFAVLSLSLNNDDRETVEWDGNTVGNVQLYTCTTKPIVQYHISTSTTMRRVEQHQLTEEKAGNDRVHMSPQQQQQQQQQQRKEDESLSGQSPSGLLTPQAIRAASASNTPASSVSASSSVSPITSITVSAAQTPPSVKILQRPPAINSSVLPTSLGSPSSSPTSSHQAAALLVSPSRSSPEVPETPASSPAVDQLQPPHSTFGAHSPGVVTFAALPAAPGQKGGAHSQLASASSTPHRDSPATSSPVSPTSGTKRRARVLDVESKEKEQDSGDGDDSKEARRDKQEANLIARLDKLFTRHFTKLATLQQQTTERAMTAQRDELEKERKERSNVEKQRTEGLLRVVSQSLQKQLDDAVTKGISTSMQSNAAGGGAVDVEALAASLSQSLRAPLHESFKATFGSVLLPGFEASTRVMFKQIESVYAKMSESNEQMLAERVDELVREKLAAEGGKREEIAELRAALAQLTATNATLLKTLTVVQQQHQQQSTSIAELKSIMQHSLASHTASSASAPASAASAAQPPAAVAAATDPKQEISVLLQHHQYEQAFTRALSLGKLPLVTWLCSQLDPRILLYTNNPAHKLSPAVLLSLIQQLGYTLKEDAAVKLLWIRECVMVLNRQDASISKHVPAVLRDVLGRVEDELSGTWKDSADRSLFEQGRTVKHLLSAMVGGATSP